MSGLCSESRFSRALVCVIALRVGLPGHGGVRVRPLAVSPRHCCRRRGSTCAGLQPIKQVTCCSFSAVCPLLLVLAVLLLTLVSGRCLPRLASWFPLLVILFIYFYSAFLSGSVALMPRRGPY